MSVLENSTDLVAREFEVITYGENTAESLSIPQAQRLNRPIVGNFELTLIDSAKASAILAILASVMGVLTQISDSLEIANVFEPFFGTMVFSWGP